MALVSPHLAVAGRWARGPVIGRVICAATVSAALFPVGASSSDASISGASYDGTRVYASPFGRGGITFQAGDAENSIVIETDDSRAEILIIDEAGARVDPRFPDYEPLCNQVGPKRVRCALYQPGGIRGALGDGDDSVMIDSTGHAPVVIGGYAGDDTITVENPSEAAGSRLQGYLGADVIVAGASDDFIFGGPGPDLLAGSAGDDRIRGAGRRPRDDVNADGLRGGPGDDRLHARNGDEDLYVRCGSGEDVAYIDQNLDPPPVGCEEVIAE